MPASRPDCPQPMTTTGNAVAAAVAPSVDPARRRAVELHLLEQHRHVLVGHVLADEPLIISWMQLGADRRRARAAAVAVVGDHLERELADLGLVLLGHVALHLVEEQALRACSSPRMSAGSPDMWTSDSISVGMLTSSNAVGDLLVRRRKGLSGMWVAHRLVLSRRIAELEHVSEIRDGG